MSAVLKNLSIEEFKKIDKLRTKEINNKYKQYKEKQKLIERIKKKESLFKKISLSPKQKPKPLISNPKNKQEYKPKTKPKTKTFDDYFQECIKNKSIPPHTPSYLRKALERAIKEYEQGIEKEKSALDEFANKYIVKGEPGILPFENFKYKSRYLRAAVRKYRLGVCKMKKSKIPKLCQNIGLGKLFLEKYLLVRLDYYFTRTATELVRRLSDRSVFKGFKTIYYLKIV